MAVLGGKDFPVALPLHVLNHTVLTAKYSHDSGAGRKEQLISNHLAGLWGKLPNPASLIYAPKMFKTPLE
ncbi:hypothetical protein OUZ56_000979 [Daphnia magna]|uniref:Uncharacterized protein n=1 Tax=Daphnia magna TaxID=35525 RepID=A0ABR0A1W0_9CRUS|nr:hypothetical protein OUZ56_000979 [Daphnia magna]